MDEYEGRSVGFGTPRSRQRIGSERPPVRSGHSSQEERVIRDLLKKRVSDDDEFEYLIRLIQRRLVGFFRSAPPVRLTIQDAEDLFQEFIIKFYKVTQYQYKPEQPLWPFLLRIAYNDKVDLLRRMSRDAAHSEPLDVERMMVADSLGARADEAIILDEALASLSHDQHEAVFLHCDLGYTMREVAEILDVPLTTVQGRLHEARKRVARYYRAGRTEP
jgi:RNA polymerase sigma factor (sigma-70 family)